MPTELFNQALKSTLVASDRIASGIPGLVGADNITAQDLFDQAASWNVLTGTFNNGDLSGGDFTINHAKNTLDVKITVYDGSGYQQIMGGIFKVVDADNVVIEFGGAISGTWRYILEYYV